MSEKDKSKDKDKEKTIQRRSSSNSSISSVSTFDEEDDVPAATAPVEAKPAQKAEDILAMIRARQKA